MKIITLAFLIFIYSNIQAVQKNNIDDNSATFLYKQEINKRFADKAWAASLTGLSERALLQEYTHMVGISNHLAAKSINKHQKIEALLATYASIKMQQNNK
jgi:murein DD-endopeptidase